MCIYKYMSLVPLKESYEEVVRGFDIYDTICHLKGQIDEKLNFNGDKYIISLSF